MMQLAQIAEAVNGQMIGPDVLLQGASTDTRSDCQGRLFIALNGENFDAHDFVAQAHINGAGAAMIEHEVDVEIPKVLVQSSYQALQDLAAWWRSQFVLPVVGVTGSVGKTSVKEMLGSIFAGLGEGLVTRGNFNNEIGLPLTLLRLKQEDRYAIIEMGMNHAGEISRLSAITKPTIALVNNAAAAHLEGMGTVEAVAHAKGEIFESLSADGTAVINLDDDYAGLWLDQTREFNQLTFGLNAKADVTAEYSLGTSGSELTIVTAKQRFALSLPVIGEHNIKNALAAAAVSLAANLPVEMIIAGLEAYQPISGRLDIQHFGELSLIDDSYNANPASMRAAIDTLAQFEHSILIVGDMAELGETAEQAHRAVGEYAQQQNIEQLYVCGEFASLVAQGFGGAAHSFATQQQLIEQLPNEYPAGAVLVKGSRSSKMERIVAHIVEQLDAQLKANAMGQA